MQVITHTFSNPFRWVMLCPPARREPDKAISCNYYPEFLPAYTGRNDMTQAGLYSDVHNAALPIQFL